MNTFPMFIMVEEVTPRSRKCTYYIGKLDVSQNVYPRYSMWAKCYNEREAIDRVQEMNRDYQRRQDAANAPTT